jgi:uncharacterized membrane protein YeaQ/YmgE (transglycosylase-associated protein family)
MNDLKDWQDLLIYLLLGIVAGVLIELLARRKVWLITLQRLIAVVIGIIGGFIGSFVLDTLLNLLNDPEILNVSVLPVVIGALLALAPWWYIRSGRSKLSQNQQWRRAYWRK